MASAFGLAERGAKIVSYSILRNRFIQQSNYLIDSGGIDASLFDCCTGLKALFRSRVPQLLQTWPW